MRAVSFLTAALILARRVGLVNARRTGAELSALRTTGILARCPVSMPPTDLVMNQCLDSTSECAHQSAV